MATPKLPDLRSMAAADAAKYKIPGWLFNAQIGAESGWDPNAQSPAGAQGLGQLMPATARGLGVTDPSDPTQNLDAAARYLQAQYNHFGRWDLALAAYNAGPGAVQSAGNKVPGIAETQNYVKDIMSQRPAGGGMPSAPASDTGVSLPDFSAMNTLTANSPSQDPQRTLMNFAGPSQTTVDLLNRSSANAGQIAKRSQNEIPLPNDQSNNQPTSGSPAASDGQQDPYTVPTIPIKGGLIDGKQQMTTGNEAQLRQRFPNLITQSHVDWSHVNNRLLKVVSDVAKSQLGPTAVVTMTSGYRDNGYSAANGGFSGDPHTKGLAGDFYVDGHPIGDVIPPEVWAKYGVRSGNTPGFYKGQPDSEHLDLIGMPIKGGGK